VRINWRRASERPNVCRDMQNFVVGHWDAQAAFVGSDTLDVLACKAVSVL
jgi:hypothetical protein